MIKLLDNSSTKNKKTIEVLFSQQIELEGVTRQMLLTKRKLPFYADQIVTELKSKTETNGVQLLLVGSYGAKFMIFQQTKKNVETFALDDVTSELYGEYLEQDFAFGKELEEGKFLLIPPDLKVARMVLYDQESVNLSSFGNPEIDFITTKPEPSSIIDVSVPPEFSFEKAPLVFLRFSDGIKVLNMATRNLTEIAKAPLTQLPYRHPVE